jgi:hypothetical protein
MHLEPCHRTLVIAAATCSVDLSLKPKQQYWQSEKWQKQKSAKAA